MRVTDGAMFRHMKSSLLDARERAVNAQEAASEGLRVKRPSDDPVAFAQARLQHSRDALATAGASMAQQATDRLQSADSALDSANNVLARLRELALQGASETLSAENRADIAEEVDELRKQLVTLGNTEVAGQYVFGGNGDGAPPYNADGSFNGSATSRIVQIFPGVQTDTIITGGEAFGSGTPNDVFTGLTALATALRANNTDAIRGSLVQIDTAADRVTNARARAGSLMDSLDVAQSVASRYGYDAKTSLDRLVNLDEVSAASDLMRATTAYQAAVAAAQQIPTNGLASR
jgi:flagellar hook-associated protein 3 FlgL